MNNYTVYAHITPSNKRYIGITGTPIQKRFGKNGNGYKTSKYFWRAIQKYGWDNIQHIVLYRNLTKEEACKKEQELIAQYQSNNSKFGYNCSLGGESGGYGTHLSDEARKKISIANKGRKHPHTEYQDKLQSKRLKGNTLHLGYKASEESRKRMSEVHTGLALTQKQLDNLHKIHQQNIGIPRSEETKEKIRKAHLGKKKGPWSAEARKAHMDANERRRQEKAKAQSSNI